MYLSFLIVLLIGFCTVIAIYFIEINTAKPSKLTYIFGCSTVIIWILFFTGFFTHFPDKVANVLWDCSWIGLIIYSFITFVYELKNSILFALITLIISFINIAFYSFSIVISTM